MTNQLGDAPTERAAREARNQRTMLELRYLYGGAPDKDDTQEIVIHPPPFKVRVWWRLRLAQVARRVFGK